MKRLNIIALALALAIFLAAPLHAQTNSAAAPAPKPAAAPATTPAEAAPSSDEIQRTIELLEDETKRNDLVRLLKLMDTLQTQGKDPAAAVEAAAKGGPTAPQKDADMIHSIRQVTKNIYDGVGLAQSNLVLSLQYFGASMKEALIPENMEIWRGFVITVCIWALICHTLSWIIIRRYPKAPRFGNTPWSRFWAFFRHIAITCGPSLVLIVSILIIPPMAADSAAQGNRMLMKAIAFIQEVTQVFFITCSGLYVVQRIVLSLFEPNVEGKSIVPLAPALARHFINSLKVLSFYVAAFVFVRWTIINQFAMGSLPYLATVVLILPMPLFLTARLLKLGRLVNDLAILENAGRDDDEAPLKSEEGGQRPVRPRYTFDRLLKAHWASILISYSWVLTILAIFNYYRTEGHFVESLFSSLMIVTTTFIFIWLERGLVLRLVSQSTEHGQRIAVAIDNLVSSVAWILAIGSILALWGIPVKQIINSPLAETVFARALAIALTIAGLSLLLRFSRLVAEWLMTSPELSQNRMWRTMTPLVQTALKALAVFVAIVVILERLGVNVGPILAGAGILGLGVGMGAQSLIKDLINGVSILLLDTMVVGDYVQIGSIGGTVEAIGLRSVRLRDPSGNLAIVPNSSVDTIINMTKDFSQEIIDLLLPYDADPDRMLALAKEVGKSMEEDDFWSTLLINPVEVMGVLRIDEKGTTIRIRLHTVPGVQWSAGREMKLRLKRALLKAGVKAPYQQLLMERNYAADEKAATVKSSAPVAATAPKPEQPAPTK